MSDEDFVAGIKNLTKRVISTRETILTEEATKMSLIVPLFKILGYDYTDPSEVVPEFIADVGDKKGEKVDYAICVNGVPMILIEAKWCGENLEKHDWQLKRYFTVTHAKFAILTNGIIYRFFTDLDEPNKMDDKPFLEINMLDLKDSQISELRKFAKDSFDVDTIFGAASELKHTNNAKQRIADEIANPSDAFVRLIIDDIFDGKVKTQRVVEEFRPIIKRSFSQYINELINDRLKSALEAERKSLIDVPTIEETVPASNQESKSDEPTKEMLQAFYIIRGMLADIIQPSRITFKNSASYFSIICDESSRKCICRLRFRAKSNVLMIIAPEPKTLTFSSLDDLYGFKQNLVESTSMFM